MMYLQASRPESWSLRVSPALVGLNQAQWGKVEGLATVDMRFWRISPSNSAAAQSETSEIARRAGPSETPRWAVRLININIPFPATPSGLRWTRSNCLREIPTIGPNSDCTAGRMLGYWSSTITGDSLCKSSQEFRRSGR